MIRPSPITLPNHNHSFTFLIKNLFTAEAFGICCLSKFSWFRRTVFFSSQMLTVKIHVHRTPRRESDSIRETLLTLSYLNLTSPYLMWHSHYHLSLYHLSRNQALPPHLKFLCSLSELSLNSIVEKWINTPGHSSKLHPWKLQLHKYLKQRSTNSSIQKIGEQLSRANKDL